MNKFRKRQREGKKIKVRNSESKVRSSESKVRNSESKGKKTGYYYIVQLTFRYPDPKYRYLVICGTT